MGTSRLISTLLSFFIWVVLRFPVSVESALVASCSFESDLCSWTTPSWSDGNWTRSIGSDTTLTGPLSSALNVTGGSWFIVLRSGDFNNQANIVQPGKKVTLLTPELPRVQCIAFLYMKHGDDNIGDLMIGVAKNGIKLPDGLWKKTGKTRSVWECKAISTNVEDKAIYFEALSSTILGDVAMDQIMLYDNACPVPTDCFTLLNASAITSTTTTPTPTPTPTPTTISSPSLSTADGVNSPTPTSPNATITTTQKEGGTGEELDTAILLSVVIPIVVLLVAGIAAFICYRKRRETTIRLRRESAQQNLPPYYVRNDEEEYDVIHDSDVVPDHYDTIKSRALP